MREQAAGDGAALLQHLSEWYEARRSALAARGVSMKFSQSPDDGRNKASAFLAMGRGPDIVDLGVWDSGEAELAVGWSRGHDDYGTTLAEHLDLVTVSDLDEVLARMLRHLDGPDAPNP